MGTSLPEATDSASALLRAAGRRVTRPRVAVLAQLIAAGDEHVSAGDLLDRMAAVDADVHPATVYRTLDGLTDDGVLVHVHLDRGQRAYHLAGPDHVHDGSHPHVHHLHAQCVDCGRVVDLPPDALGDAIARVRESTGFELDVAHVALSGRCEECARPR